MENLPLFTGVYIPPRWLFGISSINSISGQFKKEKKTSNKNGVRFGAQPHPFYFCEHHTGAPKKTKKKGSLLFDGRKKKLNSCN